MLTQPLIGHRELRGIRAGQMPRSVGAAPRRDRLQFAHVQLQQVSDPGPSTSPLYPEAHADSPTGPLIDLRNRPVVLADPELPHPTLQIVRQLGQAHTHRNAPVPVGEPSHRPLESRQGPFRPADLRASEREPEKRELVGSDDLASRIPGESDPADDARLGDDP